MGTTFSVLPEYSGPLTPSSASVVGIDGKVGKPWMGHSALLPHRGTQLCSHSFLVTPTCPVLLIERDLLAKLQASLLIPSLQSITHVLNPHTVLLLTLESHPNSPAPNSSDPTLLSSTDPRVWDTQHPSAPFFFFFLNHSPFYPITGPLCFYLDTRDVYALSLLAQHYGPNLRSVAYFS